MGQIANLKAKPESDVNLANSMGFTHYNCSIAEL